MLVMDLHSDSKSTCCFISSTNCGGALSGDRDLPSIELEYVPSTCRSTAAAARGGLFSRAEHVLRLAWLRFPNPVRGYHVFGGTTVLVTSCVCIFIELPLGI